MANVTTKKRRRRTSHLGPMIHGIYLPKDLYDRICLVADAERNSAMSVIRRLLARALQQEQAETAIVTKKGDSA